jgi:hypothetical protein
MVIVGGQVNAILDRLRRHLVHTEKRPHAQRRRGPSALADSTVTPG